MSGANAARRRARARPPDVLNGQKAQQVGQCHSEEHERLGMTLLLQMD